MTTTARRPYSLRALLFTRDERAALRRRLVAAHPTSELARRLGRSRERVEVAR